jgi:hypothetical protein
MGVGGTEGQGVATAEGWEVGDNLGSSNACCTMLVGDSSVSAARRMRWCGSGLAEWPLLFMEGTCSDCWPKAPAKVVAGA